MKASNSIFTKSLHLHQPTNFKFLHFHHFHKTYIPNLQNPNKITFFRVCCKIKVPQDKNKPVSQKNVLFDGAPSLKEDKKEGDNGGEGSPQPKKPTSSMNKFLKRLPQKGLAFLSNLPLAIGEMFAIAGLMALGTSLFSPSSHKFYRAWLFLCLMGSIWNWGCFIF